MSDLQTIFDQYNPEHDINTNKDAPRVTWAEMALAIQVQSLIDRVEKLEAGQRHPIAAPALPADVARVVKAAARWRLYEDDIAAEHEERLHAAINLLAILDRLSPESLKACAAALTDSEGEAALKAVTA